MNNKNKEIKNIASETLGVEEFQNLKEKEKNYHRLHRKNIQRALLQAYEAGQSAVNIILTSDELKELGDLAGDIREDLELQNNAFEFIGSPDKLKNVDYQLEYYKVHQLTNALFYKNQKLMKELDIISFLLIGNDNGIEIEEARLNNRKFG